MLNPLTIGYERQIGPAERAVSLVIKRSRRKTMAIHVFPHRQPVEVRVPLKCAWHDIDRFISSRQDWILAAVEELADSPVPQRPSYSNGGVVPFLGALLPLETYACHRRTVSLAAGVIAVGCRNPDSEQAVERALHDWYRARAAMIFEQRIAQLSLSFPESVVYRDLRFRKMRSRWGSCSDNGVLTFNSQLMLYPFAAVDVVIAHELCHLFHFGHNRQFYELLAHVMPDWREKESLLKFS